MLYRITLLRKKIRNVIFQVVSQKWEVKMNPGAGLEAAVFTSIWENVLLLPSKDNAHLSRS